MKTLVIAEKPSVARDIARVLGCSVVNSRVKNILKEMNTLSPGDWDIW